MPVPSVQVCTFWLFTRNVMDSPPTVPRAHLSLAGSQDQLTPAAGLDKIDADLKKAYDAAGHPDRWKLSRYDVGHLETPGMREEIRQWLVTHL